MATAIYCWGSDQHGQLGLGADDLTVVSVPRLLPATFEDEAEPIQHIACGQHHTLIALKNGQTYSCGSNDYRQLGHDKSGNRLDRISALDNLHVSRLALGISHSLVLHRGGEIYSWGDNSRGQLGRAAVDDDEWWRIPKLVKELALHTVIQISSGFYHCIALTNDGDVWCWGANNHGQLGVGTNTEYCDRPQLLQCMRGIPVAQVAAGAYHSFVVSKSGALFGWGRNSFGQLGLNDEIDRNTPTFCKFLKNQRLKYVSCGENHTAVLTQEGGVYTFGAGGYGQLGHGTTHSEITPKMVMELMGTPITQVSCGRRHTLAYTPENGRIYAFGLGSSGQLGLGTTDNRTSPFPIKGCFVSAQQPDSDLMETDAEPTSSSSSQYVVKRIYSGGDHCFVISSSSDLSISPDDFRLCNYEQQPLTLSAELLQQLYSVSEEEQVCQDLLESIEKIWSSSSCLNGSFLKEDHAGCNSKNHGVDLKYACEQLSGLAQLSNKTVASIVWSQLTENLIPNLPKSPPHVEALRLYLILPELPYMDQPHWHSSLITPFGLKLISLDRAALKVLELWWATLESKFFSRIVYVYKQCLSHVLSITPVSESEQRVRRRTMLVSMEVLKKLNSVNESNGQIIPYHQFYVPEVKEAVDIRKHYILWLQKNRSAVGDRTESENPFFCDYAFLFDAATKSVLLQTDALLQMQYAIEEVNLRNFTSFFQAIDPINPCLVLFVHRDRIMQDTLDQLNKYGHNDLKKPLKVIFVGEEAVDEGGVTKEFFMLIMREILNPDYGMFKYYEESRLQWFNSETFEETDKFHMIGTICGLAIYNFTIIVLPFPLALFKKLLNRYYTMSSSSGSLKHHDKNKLGSANKTSTPAHFNLFKPVILEDLKELMPSVGRGIEQVLEYDGDDFVEVFDLTFELSVESYGNAKNVELVPDGSKKPVTKENKKEFADAYVDYIFNKSVEEVFRAFSAGFVRVCGGRALELFHPRELQAMVIGNDQYDFLELEKNTTYKDEYHRYHTTIKFFWEVFLDLPLEDKRKFLLFLTGSDRIPITGMGSVKLIIQPTKGGEEYLPVAHTCFNILDLPKYNSKEKLREKLVQAINQTEGFGLV